MSSRILFYSLIITLFFSCKNDAEKNTNAQQNIAIKGTAHTSDKIGSPVREIAPPIKDVQSHAETKNVKGNAADTLVFSTGSVIIIPANALADENGKLVSGNCQIVFEEYLDPASVILSGIPMIAEEGGKLYPFTSAGMFSIHATSAGKKLVVAPGKTIAVKQATSVKKGTYDFFKFNETEKRWEKTGKTDPEKNALTKQVVELQDNKPVKPVLKNDKGFTFDMNINTNDFPEFTSMQNIIWQSAKEKGFSDAEKDQDKIFNTLWYEIELKPYKKDQSKYILQLTNDKETYRTVITPTLELKDYEAAMNEFNAKMKDYEANKQTEQIKRKTERVGSDIVRSIEIAAFGIYNHDIICKMGGAPVTCKALFKQTGTAYFIPLKAYLISKTSNTIIQYGAQGYDTYEKFIYDPEDTYGLLTLDSIGGIGYVAVKEFERAKQNKNSEASFAVVPYEGKIRTAEDLRKVLMKM